MAIGETFNEIIFAPFISSAALKTATWPTIGSNAFVQGHVDRVFVNTRNTNGSAYLFESGTNVALATIVFSSGATATSTQYPRLFTYNTVGTTLSGTAAANATMQSVVNPIYMTASGLSSGTALWVSGIHVYLTK